MAATQPRSDVISRLNAAFEGPLPVLPEPLDDLAERWAGARPRARAAILALVAVAVLLIAGSGAARSPFGRPVEVVVVRSDLAAGHLVASDDLTVRAWPEAIVPAGAVTTPEQAIGATLSAGIAAGQPLAAMHLAGGGLGSLVREDEVALPVPVPYATEYVAGDHVDVFGGDAGVLLVGDARVLASEGDIVWLALPRDRAGDVAAAARWDQALVALRPG